MTKRITYVVQYRTESGWRWARGYVSEQRALQELHASAEAHPSISYRVAHHLPGTGELVIDATRN